MNFDYKEDGLTHLNIYSKALTELGRLLSNFAHTPLKLPQDGKFVSIEGYWYWLLSVDPSKERLRFLSGFEAKEIGREIAKHDWPNENFEFFKFKVYQALIAKVIQTPGLEQSLINSSLPFTHYYVYNNKVIDVKEAKWLVEAWEQIRKDVKQRHNALNR